MLPSKGSCYLSNKFRYQNEFNNVSSGIKGTLPTSFEYLTKTTPQSTSVTLTCALRSTPPSRCAQASLRMPAWRLTRGVTAPISTSESPTFGILTKTSISPRILDWSTPSTPCNPCLQPCRLTHKIPTARASTRNRGCVHISDAWCHRLDWPESACGDPQWHGILGRVELGPKYARGRTNTRCKCKYSQIIPVAWDKIHLHASVGPVHGLHG